MTIKDQVHCKLPHKMDRFLNHYQEQNGLNNSEVFELAAHQFLDWYNTHHNAKEPLVLRSMPNTAIPFRGYLPTETKKTLTEIADEDHHLLADLMYTMVNNFCVHEGFKDTIHVACVVSADVHDFLTHRAPQLLDDQHQELPGIFSDFVHNFAQEDVSSLTIQAPPIQGERIAVQLTPDVVESMSEIKHTLGCSLRGLYTHVIETHVSTTYTWSERVPVSCTLTSALYRNCTEYVANKHEVEGRPVSQSEFFDHAVSRFLDWYRSNARPKDWTVRTPHLDGEVWAGFMNKKYQSSLSRMPYPADELLFTAVDMYCEEEGIKSGYRDLKSTKIPSSSLTVLYLEPEQKDIIDFLVRIQKFQSEPMFYHTVVTWWLDKRDKFEGFYDHYIAYQQLSKAEDAVKMTLSLELELHHRLKHYAKLDGQTIRTVYNNAIVEYLDYLLETTDPEELRVTYSIEDVLKNRRS